MQVAPGVFQFKVPMPSNRLIPGGGIRYTLVYLVSAPLDRWVIIDAGMNSDEGFRALKEQLIQSGITPSDVVVNLITHIHPDHSGLANRLKELTGAPIAMHKLDTPGRSESSRWWHSSNQAVRRKQLKSLGFPSHELNEAQSHGQRTPESDPDKNAWAPPEVDIQLDGGEELLPSSGLWTMWTPGHTDGHLCVYDMTRRLFFSGDHVLPTITPHVSLSPGEEGDPLARFIEALGYVRNLDVETVCPAHEYTFPDLHSRVDEVLSHHSDRFEEIYDQLAKGPRTPYQISAGIKWNVAPWAELHPSTKRMALMETVAHLKYMEGTGQVTRKDSGDLVFYEKASTA